MPTRLFAPAALMALAAATVGATSYLPISDEALVRQAPVIAQVSVLSTAPAPARGVPAVDTIVVVERLLKGQIAGSTVVVRVAGGVGPDGWGLELVGAPTFAPGDRAILFLVPQDDGTYGILHLMLGAFYEFESGRSHLALRDLLEAQAMTPGDEPPQPRSFAAFADWIAAGAPREASYRVAAPERAIERWRNGFALLRQEQRRLRWSDAEVAWLLGSPAPPRSRRLLRDALQAWNPGLDLRLTYAGRSEASGRLTAFDGVNVVAFDDPDRTIPGAFSCRDGGVVAVGGPWFDPELEAGGGSPGGVAIRILGADIVLNDGAGCLLSGFEGISREVLIHELGHTLGLAFACGDSAGGPCSDEELESVMRPFIHRDGAPRHPGELERRRLNDPR